MLDTTGKEPIHYPAIPDKFEFDQEVADIFDNIAVRSIPMYDEARRLTVMLSIQHIKENISRREELCVLDVGSSTGAYYKTLWKVLGYEVTDLIPGVRAVAVEKSKPMLKKIMENLPLVNRVLGTITESFQSEASTYSIINMAYVVQFMSDDDRRDIWKAAYRLLKPGGLLIVSAKEDIPYRDAGRFNSLYIQFRRDNGYTDKEIEAKTKALKGSMHINTSRYTTASLTRVGFIDCQEVCRWLQFSTLVAYKRG